VVPIGFFRKLLGIDRTDDDQVDPRLVWRPEPPPPPVVPPEPAPAAVVSCPNCGIVLDPPPKSTRLCPRCRHRIVVRRVEGRTIYLTEAAVEVFEAERQRGALEQTWSRQRRDWLLHGRQVGVPAERRQRIEDAPLTAASVQAARTLYMTHVERAARIARRDKHWEEVARLRRRQAAALYDEAGATPPPSDEVLGLYREGMAATLRELAAVAKGVELVGATCCAACRADNERTFKIADELRTPRLPHPECPRGLCACDWWPAVHVPPPKRRRRTAPTG
jgi:hypothetical protein